MVRAAWLDAVLLALPVNERDTESMALFDDPFLLAVPAAIRVGQCARDRARHRSGQAHSAGGGHCLRDQASPIAPVRGATWAEPRCDKLGNRDADGGNGYG